MEENTLILIGLFVLNIFLAFLIGFEFGERLGVKDYSRALLSSRRSLGNLVVPLPPNKDFNLYPQQEKERNSINPSADNPPCPSFVETGKKQNINEYLGV